MVLLCVVMGAFANVALLLPRVLGWLPRNRAWCTSFFSTEVAAPPWKPSFFHMASLGASLCLRTAVSFAFVLLTPRQSPLGPSARLLGVGDGRASLRHLTYTSKYTPQAMQLLTPA